MLVREKACVCGGVLRNTSAVLPLLGRVEERGRSFGSQQRAGKVTRLPRSSSATPARNSMGAGSPFRWCKPERRLLQRDGAGRG